MSVAEFVIAATLSLPLLFGAHECVRLYSIHRSAEVLMLRKVSKIALSSLAHTQKGTFSETERHENEPEIHLKRDFETLLRVPILHWQWSTGLSSDERNPLLGLKVSVVGPSRNEPFRNIEAHTTLCVQSWIEPLIRIVADGRTCVGEYLSNNNKQQSTSRGIALKISALREIPATVYVFHQGVYRNANLLHEKE